jgi:uncharacterized spore protein YtfJ
MDKEMDALLDGLADLRAKANANAVFGNPVTAEGRTVIPVAKVAYGFGMGIGHEMMVEEAEAMEAEEPQEEEIGDSAGGGGGGVMAQPIAVVEVTPEGTRVQAVINEQRLALAGGALGAWVAFWLAWTLVKIFGREAR